MKEYTQADLDNLISCAKRVDQPPRKEMKLERGQLRNDFWVASIDEKFRFKIFMRINEMFRENFSIGLDFVPSDEPGSLCLLRCNGPHGEHCNDPVMEAPHFGYHVHLAKAERLENGSKSEKFAQITNEYGSYREALSYFIKAINIVDADDFFPKPQLQLFEQEEDKS